MNSKNTNTESRRNNPEPEGQNPDSALSLESRPAALNEDTALALLKSPDITTEALAQLAKNPSTAKSRKVLVGLAAHPRTPRHVSIPLLRHMFTFDLMNLALAPTVAPDVKRAAEEQILTRLESIPAGQKITLARRASGRIATALLQTSDPRIIAPALDNKRLTEPLLVQALMKPDAPEILFARVSNHPTWSQRREVQIAMLRSDKTLLEHALVFAKNFSEALLREIVPEARRDSLLGVTNSSPGDMANSGR